MNAESRFNRWPDFPPSKPIPVADGLVSSHQRGEMASEWWSKHFIEALESYGLGGRMQRGRRYARQGQVVSLDVSTGVFEAKVQGSRPRPYQVRVRLRLVTDKQWESVEAELGSRIGLVASLMAGEVSSELVDAFDDAGISLLPHSWRDFAASCNCPDSASPCKHLAAALYVFADRLDSNPWLLLQWRGRSQEQIMESVRRHIPLPSDEFIPSVAPVASWWPFKPGEIHSSLAASSEFNNPPPTAGSEPSGVELLPTLVLGPTGNGQELRSDELAGAFRPAYEAMEESLEEGK